MPEKQIDWRGGDRWRLDRGLRIGGVPLEHQRASWGRLPGGNSTVRAYAAEVTTRAAQGRGLMLLGPVGTGKSSAASLVCQEAVIAGLDIAWVYVPDLVDLLSLSTRSRMEELERQRQADIVVWDDFGLGEASAWQLRNLDRAADRLYRTRTSLLVTTNLDVRELKELKVTSGYERIMDRLAQRNAIAVLSGPSQRRGEG